MKHYTVYIGRFSPCHKGHLSIIKKALEVSDELIIVLGSHNDARSIRNPFSTSERIDFLEIMIAEELPNERNRIHFVPIEDQPYNDTRWLDAVQASAHSITFKKFSPDPQKISLIGHSKDHSSFYLKMFPTWGSIDCDNFEGINSTDIRKWVFEYEEDILDNSAMTPKVNILVKNWIENSKEYPRLLNEYELINKYHKQWANSPYPPTFVTTDAVVVQAGHILLVTRGAAPGEGQLALPGGFLNQFETLENGMIRELIEETCIDVPEKILRGSIKRNKTFDYPYRSLRGRTITEAFLIELGPSYNNFKLPKVKGADDAIKAAWYEIGTLDRSRFFEDHYNIIQTMIGA